MTINSIAQWHERARPDPIKKNFNVQLGCHFEEIQEMACVIDTTDIIMAKLLDEFDSVVSQIADRLKKGLSTVEIVDRKEFLDSLADQIVTAVGTGHCAKMDMRKAVTEVDRSNWSKYDAEGNPIFNENGKIMKGPTYTPPSLDGMY